MNTLLQTAIDPNHQADAIRKDQTFKEAICNWRIRILPRPQPPDALDDTTSQPATSIETAPSSINQVDYRQLTITVIDSEPTTRRTWTPRDIARHSERIDRRDNLWKMELELQGRTPIPKALKHALRKQDACLLPVDIYYIGAIGFYRTFIKLDVTPFITSLYKIDRIIEQKEIEAI